MIIIIIDISNQNKMLEMVSLYCNIDGKIDLINDHRYGQHTYLSKKNSQPSHSWYYYQSKFIAGKKTQFVFRSRGG